MKYKIALLFSLFSLSLNVQGQTTGKAIIHGNVYGGGEAAKVEQPEGQRGKSPAAKVSLKNGAEIYGAIFGAGKGYTKEYVDDLYKDKAQADKKTYKDYADVTGDAEVNLTGKSVIWRDMFGGGENADVKGSTFFNMSEGEVAANVFGGGKGAVTGANVTSADVSGNTSINITGGSIIWNRTSKTDADSVVYDRYWYNVTVAAKAESVTYDFEKVQTEPEKKAILANFPFNNGNDKAKADDPTYPYSKVSISGPVEVNGKQQYTVNYTRNSYTKKEWFRTQQSGAEYTLDTSIYPDGKEHVVINTVAGDVWSWDPTKPSTYKDETNKIDNSQFYSDAQKRFLIEHNIFGGGYIASKVGTYYKAGDEEVTAGTKKVGELVANTGLSKVILTKGLFDMDLIKTEQWKTAYNDHEHPHFYIFGGGYGVHTKVGKSDVYAALPIDATIGSTMETEDQLAKPMRPLAASSPEPRSGDEKEFKFDIINNSYGLPRATVLGILGGGYNGYVGETNVVIGGATFTHRVYGGGLGSFEGWQQANSPAKFDAQTDATGYSGIVSGNTMVTLIGGHIYGDAFGGGAGVAPKKNGGSYTDYPEIARVNGSTTVRTFSNKDYYNYMTGEQHVDPADMPYVWAEGLEETVPNIYGSVYGGGDVANVTANANVELHAGNVFGYTIGAGYGRKATEANDYTKIGGVGGDSKVVIEDGASTEPYAWNDIYGGGRNGLVGGSAYVHLNGGNIGDNVFGGGWGAIDNPGASEKVTSADVKGNAIVTVDKAFALWNKVADVEGNIKTWNRADYIKESTSLAGVDPLFYNAETKRFVKNHNIYGGGNVACVVGTAGNNDTYDTAEAIKATGNDFLRATLKAGAYKTGNTIVMMNESHVSDPDIFYNYAEWTDAQRWSQSALCWLTTLTEQREPQFSVFGGGYGLRTKTLHDAQARVEVLAVKYNDPEKTELKIVDGEPVEHWTVGWDYEYEHKLEWTDEEINGGTKKDELANFYPKDDIKPNYVDAERRLRTAAFAKQVGVAGNSVMQVIGGGYNGSVVGNTFASAQSRVIVGKVYGGGYGSFEGWQEAQTAGGGTPYRNLVGTVGGEATVDIDRGSLVYGDVFGGGAGVESREVNGTLTDFPDVARVGSTHVKLGAVGASEKYDFVVPVVYGSLYGGGDVANVTHNAVTDLHRGQVMQYLFGGGNGRLKFQCKDYTQLGSVDNATVNFHAIRTKSDGTPYSKSYGGTEQIYSHEPIVWQRSYGGGRNGLVRGNTNITIYGGQFGHNIFGGGWGAVTDKEGNVLTDDNGIVNPDYADKELNKDYFITSADVKGNTNIVVNGGTVNIDQVWDYANRQWTKSNYDEKGNSYSPQYDFKKTLFTIKHNIYTGGNRASNIGTLVGGNLKEGTGNTTVTMYRGMIDHQFFEKLGTPFLDSYEWRDVYHKHGTPFFCVFGGGYGENATVYGNTNVKIDMKNDVLGLAKVISPVEEETGHNHSAEGGDDIAGCDGIHDRLTMNHKKFPDAQSIMDVVGGGYNGPVKGTCNITIDGNPFIRNVFGGAYYSPVGSTNVNVLSGNIDNIYGGGMMGDVEHQIRVNLGTKTADYARNDNASKLGSAAEENARLVILGDVYGANDVSGLAGAHYDDEGKLAADAGDGVAINLYGGHIKGNVYGGGNGNYLYMVDKDLDSFTGKVTANEQYVVNGKEKLVYGVPMRDAFGSFQSSNDVQRIINIATFRPVTIRTEISMQGNQAPAEDADYLKVDGSVFGGGNSATVSNFASTSGGEDAKAGVTLNIGSNIDLGALFLGNDGEAMFTNEADNSFLRDFPTLNNLTLSKTINWADPENASITEEYFATPKAVRPQIYKNLLDLYFLPVEMTFVPKVNWGTGNTLNTDKFNGNHADVPTDVLDNVTIGTFCCGGNRGNMTTSDHVSLVFPQGLTITDKIVGGCNDANYQMGVGSGNVTEHIGGYLYGTHQFAYTQNGSGKFDGGRETTAPQIHLVMKNKFRLKTDEDGNYLEGGNVYGGCYKSGNVRGDIELDMRADMLVDENGQALDEEVIEKIRTAFENDHLSVASVYGAGYGTNTFVYGDTRVTLGNATAKDAGTYGKGASVYNLFGGGQQGNLIGTSHVQILNGRTAGNTVGGSYAGYQYGSTNVLVGYPRYYITQESGKYTLLRKDDNATHLAYVDAEGNKYVKQEIYLLKGAGVSNAVMSEITHKDGVDISASKDNYFTQITSHYTPKDFGLNWNQVDINVNRAIYGGGYSLASGSSVGAGAKTVRKMTDKYNLDDFKDLYGLAGPKSTVGHGGNTNVMLCDLTPNNGTDVVDDDKAATCENDHITLSTGLRTRVYPDAAGYPLFGLYYKRGGTYIFVNNRNAKYLDSKTANHTGLDEPTEADMESVEYYRYTGEGGLFGDGHLSLSEGFRFGEVTRYGFAGTSQSDAKLMNCIHRFDVVRVKDCCMSLMGDRDYVSTATGDTDTTPYSIARVGELQMTSDIDDSQPLNVDRSTDGSVDDFFYLNKKIRNYIGLSSNVRNLGCLYSDVSFDETRHQANGTLDTDSKTYKGFKSGNIAANYDYEHHKVDDDPDKQSAFMFRNDGTAHNLVGIASGLALAIQDEAYLPASSAKGLNTPTKTLAVSVGDEKEFYGPLKGVIEVSLINVVPGEAGGYVYADNKHADPHTSFLEEDGNVVYPITNPESARKVVDECYPQDYDAAVDGHYWYVAGYIYNFNCNISAYTSDAKDVAKDFYMKYNLGKLKLVGYKPTKTYTDGHIEPVSYLDKIKVVSFSFLPHDDSSYPCDINNRYRTDHAIDLTDHYDLELRINGADDGNPETTDYISTFLDSSINEENKKALGASDINEPVVEIILWDKKRNNAMDVGDGQTYFEKYLSQPCVFQVVLEVPDELYHQPGYTSKAVDETYTYTITTTIQYVQGPNYTGDIDVSCALPGEMIRLSKKNLQIKTDEISMPKIAEKWEVGKLSVTGDPGHEVYSIDQTDIINRAFTIDASHADGMFGDGEQEAAEENRELPSTFYDKTDDYIYIPAYYYMNGYGVKYSFKVQGVDDWIPVTINPEKSLLVHNYHRMKTGKDEGGKDVDVKIRKAAERAAAERAASVTNPLPLPRVYIEDAEDMAALKTYLTEANAYGANVDFHLMNDITVPSWTAPATFAGNFHGNGHVLRITDTEQPLFATNSGSIYNLGMNNSTVATTNAGAIINSYAYGKHIAGSSTGTITNCYTTVSDNSLVGETYATKDEWTYGKVAYDLNGYYTKRRAAKPAAVSEGGSVLAKPTLSLRSTAPVTYVEQLYANGDYQYALQHSDADEYLRTNNLPHYGGKTTYHITTHDVDEARAQYATVNDVKTFDKYQPLYESAKIDEEATTTVVKNDYLFFAQHMQKGEAILPSAITPASHAVADMYTRVYRAYGYMHSKLNGFNATSANTDPGFYFNRMTNVYNPALTAINFTAADGHELDIDIPMPLQQFNLDDAVTRNLLVYTEPNAADALTYGVVNTALNYNEAKAEADIKGHQLVKLAEADVNGNLFQAHAGANESQSLFHLVERATESQPNNDFNAPISFSVGTRAWYTRQPKYYAEHDNDAWEGIALPFTANKVEASLNGEITHFYGTPTEAQKTAPETNDKTLHHEYWLRGLVGLETDASRTVATFQRPDDSTNETTLFGTTATDAAAFNYSFNNTWFVDTYTKNYNYNDPSNQNKWYSEPHTYADYKPLTADVPYIVSFPGNSYYEFDLTSQFYNDMMKSEVPNQTVTFNNYVGEGNLLTIGVTDDASATRSTTVGGYSHTATYSAITDAQYGMNADGNQFDSNVNTVLPFRTYMTASSSGAKSVVFIGSRSTEDAIAEEFMNQGQSDEDGVEPGLIIYSRDRRLFVESTHPTKLVVHTYSGQLVRALDVLEGTNTYSGFAEGIYIVNGKKLVIR